MIYDLSKIPHTGTVRPVFFWKSHAKLFQKAIDADIPGQMEIYATHHAILSHVPAGTVIPQRIRRELPESRYANASVSPHVAMVMTDLDPDVLLGHITEIGLQHDERFSLDTELRGADREDHDAKMRRFGLSD